MNRISDSKYVSLATSVTRLRRSSSDHNNDAGRSRRSGAGSYRSISVAGARAAANGRYRLIAGKEQTGCTSLRLSIDRKDRQTDGRTPDRYIDAYRILRGQPRE